MTEGGTQVADGRTQVADERTQWLTKEFRETKGGLRWSTEELR